MGKSNPLKIIVFLYALRNGWNTVVIKKEEKELIKYPSYASCGFKSIFLATFLKIRRPRNKASEQEKS